MKKLLAVLALTIVTLAACGGDDGGGEPTDASEDFSDVVTDDLSEDLSDDSSDDLSDDQGEDDDTTPAQDLRAYLDENQPEYSDLAEGIGTVEIAADSVQVTLTLSETTDADTAVAICESTLDWGEDAELLQIEIEVEDQEDTVLATGDFEDGCEAA